MINIIFGTALITATLSGYVNTLGHTAPTLIAGGLAIVFGVRKMIKKAQRRKREQRFGPSY
ncbi:MAG: hypothetical protein KDM63_03045 [Verrucomicrobiae bacterium]|nr:hypothetical protein [Verrucomicrobiae bacterium]MCB1085995.1 hypothetical protein [Verrucomicrobiae bacterium]MCB1093385.1 hypothetical protein [Verrucomicrobiae bacterium]